MAYLRFPVPAFDRHALKNKDWSAPDLLSADDAAAKAASGDAVACAVAGSDALFEKFDIRGDNRHVVMTALPGSATMVGRSWAWFNQRVIVLDSLDAGSANIIADWKTPRTCNTRLGPEDGITVEGVVYSIHCKIYEGWETGSVPFYEGNRTLIESDDNEIRVLSSSDAECGAFHHCNLTFTWNA